MGEAQNSVTAAFAVIGLVIMLRHGWFQTFRSWAKGKLGGSSGGTNGGPGGTGGGSSGSSSGANSGAPGTDNTGGNVGSGSQSA